MSMWSPPRRTASAAALLGQPGRAAYLLRVSRRDLVVRDRDREDRPWDSGGCDRLPRAAVCRRDEPRPLVEGVVPPSVREEVPAGAGRIEYRRARDHREPGARLRDARPGGGAGDDRP